MTRSTRHRTTRASRRPADRIRVRPRLEGLEDRCLLSITEYPIPTTGANPGLITAGPDGNLWFTDPGTNSIGTMNPATHSISEYPIPATKRENPNPRGITPGPDGNVWFTEYSGDKIGMINPTTHSISEFPIPTANANPWGITAGPDGNLWFAEHNANQIGMINPTTHVITEFALSSPAREITAGPDGNLWFTEYATNKIGTINPATRVIAEFSVPTANAGPFGVTAGPDGNLWFTEWNINQVGMINPATHAVSEFPVPPASAGFGDKEITAGPDGNLWFTEWYVNQIGMINPATQVITVFPGPYTGSEPYGITAGPDGNLWFTDPGTKAIGVVTLNQTSSTHLVITQQPPTSVTAGSGFGLTVQAEDSSGNLDSSFDGTVTVALANNPGGTTLGGTLSATASGGVANVSGLTMTKAAIGYTLQVSASGVDSVITTAITVTAASPTQLVITQAPPATVKVSGPFAFQASIEDAYGNVVTTDSGTVGVAFASNPTGATLGGTLTSTASQGVASFTNLTINKTGSGYTLQVSSSGLTSATSNPISVTKNGKAASTLLAPAGSPVTDLSLAPLVLDSPDLWDGVGLKKRPRSS